MPRANNLQDMARTNRAEARQDDANLNQKYTIRTQEGISTIDAIVKKEQYIEHANRDAEILMGLHNAFGAINRRILWDTLYALQERDTGRNDKPYQTRPPWRKSSAET